MTTSVTTPTDQSLSWMGGLTQTIAQSMETQVIFGGEATQASMKLAQESANNSNEAGAEAVKAANDQKWISLVTTIVMVISIIALPVGGLISFAADAGMSAAADAGTQMAKQAVLEGLNTAKEGVTAGCIAVGSGTDVAIETGEIILVKDDLRDVVTAIQLSGKTIKKVWQNLFWAFIYNIIAIPVAGGAHLLITQSSAGVAAGWTIALRDNLGGFGKAVFSLSQTTLRPEIAGFAMAFSSVSVVMNSLLLKRYVPPMEKIIAGEESEKDKKDGKRGGNENRKSEGGEEKNDAVSPPAAFQEAEEGV